MPSTASVTTSAELPLQPITVAMFRAMVRSGTIGEKEPVYLWKGRLARRMAPNRPHSLTLDRSRRALESLIPPAFHVQQQQLVAMCTEHSTPEPHLAVLRGRPEDVPDNFPTTADLVLMVEVADSSIALHRDQADDFARKEVPTYWIGDLKTRRIEAYDTPNQGTYQRTSVVSESEDIPIEVNGQEVGRLRVFDL
ncbi:Uma2 family endonuclease [Tautonia rosea]|uniref:Uma2 family endonuclease n=1 Tax=Tautonia rosea TaxID=2728037 RepID=UPI0014734F9A|nr:Uma2 family endonuclease [Tautonia rosea]